MTTNATQILTMIDFESLSYSDGEDIFSIGALAEHLYFIESGSVEMINAQGQAFASAIKGQSFGEAAILQGGVRSAGARAKGSVICRRISAAKASEMLSTYSPLLVLILESLLLQQSMQNALRHP